MRVYAKDFQTQRSMSSHLRWLGALAITIFGDEELDFVLTEDVYPLK